MRIDKFLKVSRIIKRRTVSKEACDSGRVFLNGTKAKAGTSVSIGDIVSVEFGNKTISFEILSLDEKTAKSSADNMYLLK